MLVMLLTEVVLWWFAVLLLVVLLPPDPDVVSRPLDAWCEDVRSLPLVDMLLTVADDPVVEDESFPARETLSCRGGVNSRFTRTRELLVTSSVWLVEPDPTDDPVTAAEMLVLMEDACPTVAPLLVGTPADGVADAAAVDFRYSSLLTTLNSWSRKGCVASVRNTSSCSFIDTIKSFSGLSFFSSATTYRAKAAGSASHSGSSTSVSHSFNASVLLMCMTSDVFAQRRQASISLPATTVRGSALGVDV